jgi:hypothetical protein
MRSCRLSQFWLEPTFVAMKIRSTSDALHVSVSITPASSHTHSREVGRRRRSAAVTHPVVAWVEGETTLRMGHHVIIAS